MPIGEKAEMKNITINLVDGTFDGIITMSSLSKVKVIRVQKDRVSEASGELSQPGIYFLIVGNDSIYVGQSGLDTVGKRIMNTHSGNIDSSWHTVVGFLFSKKSVGSDQFLFIENAMCEYVHKHFVKCLTSTPAKNNCNKKYRSRHYNLTMSQIATCEEYIADIEYYISCFPRGIIPENIPKEDPGKTDDIQVKTPTDGIIVTCESKGASGKGIFTKGNKLVILKGSTISASESPSFQKSPHKKRESLKESGIISGLTFQQDWEASSVTTAAEVILGRPQNGWTAWKTEDGIAIKKLKEK